MDIEARQLQEQAKEHIRNKQRNRAILLIKLRKHKETATEKIDAQLLTILQQIEDVEWASINVQIFQAMKTGTNALNKIHEELSIDDVKCLLDETNEAIEVESQINALLAGQSLDVDDEALLAELESLSPTFTDQSLPVNATTTPTLPEAPSGDITVFPSVPVHEVAQASNHEKISSARMPEIAS